SLRLPVNFNVKYLLGPHSGNFASRVYCSSETEYPSGSNNFRIRNSPPFDAGITETVTSKGITCSTSSGRFSHFPFMAVEKALAIATLIKDDATYGLSFT